ncbi:hypothetical protein EYB53_023085 [Candidatus Chloroploca sp. M-50]|uniref:Uncharacterized protein n=1 Tax=Candidatus Chloroploca mongolica TaxID=2528176 RepID=A0ABS4DGR0_9CHLR|nr:hypothetical protein [Candidatus Chloroploca mongolica]MBP1468617.1 hypothetical protein [Candidatus Chloroploca mongolica]
MITWNYRVFREDDGDFIIREVFYDDDGAILGCTAHAVEPCGRSLEELTTSLADFQAALALPTLTLGDMPQPSMERPTAPRGCTLSSAEVRAKLGLHSEVASPKKAS